MTALVWGGVALVLGSLGIWRFEVMWKLRHVTAEKVQLLREQNAAELSRRTMDGQADLRNAELAKQTAETQQATGFVDALQEDRLNSERRVLEARTKAGEELAKEFVRAEHDARNEPQDLVEQYGRFLKYLYNTSSSEKKLGLPEFIRIVQGARTLPPGNSSP